MRQHVFGHADLLKDAHDLVVERNRTRLVVHRAGFVADIGLQTGLAEQAGGHGA